MKRKKKLKSFVWSEISDQWTWRVWYRSVQCDGNAPYTSKRNAKRAAKQFAERLGCTADITEN